MSLKDVIEAAVTEGSVPFAVAMTANAAGVTWSGSAGEAAPGVAAGPDTIFRIYSMTKAVGSLAAMILIDRGVLGIDTPVEDVLPEFGRLPVLEGWDGDVPRLRAPRRRATVRHLATHTSGLVYEYWNADVRRYLAVRGQPSVTSGLRRSLAYPLTFEPGEAWGYGIGVDWLGRLVEAVDGRAVDRFCAEEIFGPLDMASTGFEVSAEMAPRLARVKARRPEGHFVDFDLSPPSRPEFYGMGHALYSTPADYMRFLRMFLNHGALDGARVLSEAGVASMLDNHIGALRLGRMTSVAPRASADVDLFPDTPKTHSFGFMRVEADVPGMRRSGAQGWAGMLNTHYWFDPTADLAGLFMTQSLPFVEPRFVAAFTAFERAAYAA